MRTGIVHYGASADETVGPWSRVVESLQHDVQRMKNITQFSFRGDDFTISAVLLAESESPAASLCIIRVGEETQLCRTTLGEAECIKHLIEKCRKLFRLVEPS